MTAELGKCSPCILQEEKVLKVKDCMREREGSIISQLQLRKSEPLKHLKLQ